MGHERRRRAWCAAPARVGRLMHRRAPSDAAAVIGAAWPCIWLQAHLLGVEHSVCSLLRECALAMPYALAVGHARLGRRDAGCSGRQLGLSATTNFAIESDVDGVEFAQHDDGVEEHDDVAVIAVDHLPEKIENCFRVLFAKTFFSVGHSDEISRTEIENGLDELIFPFKK